MKRVLIVTQYIYPETFKSSDIAFELAKRGYKVDVLAGIPNYPEGVYTKGFGLFKRRVETVDGVRFYRCFQTPRGRRSSAIGLSLNYLSYMICASFWVLFFFSFKKRYDAIISHETSPITQVIPAIILGKIRRTPVYTWVLDVWPDALVSTIGEKKSRLILPFINTIVDFVYRNSEKILVSSKGMENLVSREYNYLDRTIYFPNWCDDLLSMHMKEIPEFPDGYIIMMAGSINEGIGVEGIIDCLEKLKNVKEIHFVFVGGGFMEQYMKDKCKEKKLYNVHFMGRYGFDMMPAFHEKADAMFLSLKPINLPHLRATVPGRLQTYMSAGKPIFAMIDGSAANLINEADCGFAVPAGDSDAFVRMIKEHVLPHKAEYKNKGLNGRNYFLKNFTKKQCIDNLENIIAQ